MTEVYCKKFNNYTAREYESFSVVPERSQSEDDIFGHPMAYKLVPYNGEFTLKRVYNGKEYFDENKKNTLFSLAHRRLTVAVVKSEEKVVLKLFLYQCDRRVSEKFYRIKTSMKYISYNLKNNRVYVGGIEDYHKKRKFRKSVKSSSFAVNFMSQYIHIINNWLTHIYDAPNALDYNLGMEVVNNFLKALPFEVDDKLTCPSSKLHKMVLSKKGVKLSDNWYVFSGTYPQPKAKDFKKFGDKYLDVIMGINKLQGDKIKRVLHKVNKFNPESFAMASMFFGKDFLLSQDDDFLKQIFESETRYINFRYQDVNSKKERNNIFEIYKLVVKEEIDQNTFQDHLRFYTDLKRFEPIKWKSRTYEEFREEHLDWTELNQFYTIGSFARKYSDKFVNEIKKPIVADGVEFYPVILLDSKDYNDESFIQSNCVKGYIKRPECFIVSIRKNSDDSKERATIEYRINDGDIYSLKRVQTLGRFNRSLDESWNEAVNRLDETINLNSIFFELPKIKCKVGHLIFESDSEFVDTNWPKIKSHTLIINLIKDNYILRWTDDRVNNVSSYGDIRLINEINDLEF